MEAATGHSARVVMTLLCGDRRISVAQAGNSGILVRTLDAAVPKGDATLLVEIDGRKKRKKIVLPEGIAEANRFAPFF